MADSKRAAKGGHQAQADEIPPEQRQQEDEAREVAEREAGERDARTEQTAKAGDGEEVSVDNGPPLGQVAEERAAAENEGAVELDAQDQED